MMAKDRVIPYVDRIVTVYVLWTKAYGGNIHSYGYYSTIELLKKGAKTKRFRSYHYSKLDLVRGEDGHLHRVYEGPIEVDRA
jgi:hypothetical protein